MLQQLLSRIAQALDARAVPYMVIGGQAVLLYGEPRLTQDIDVTLGIGAERWQDIHKVATDLGLVILPPSPEEFIRRTMVLPCRDIASGLRVDFVFSLSLYEQEALKRARVVRIQQANVRYASLEDLVIHKIVAGRPRDLEDVRTVLAKNPRADKGYIQRWLKAFESELGEPFVHRFQRLESSPRKRQPRKKERSPSKQGRRKG